MRETEKSNLTMLVRAYEEIIEDKSALGYTKPKDMFFGKEDDRK